MKRFWQGVAVLVVLVCAVFVVLPTTAKAPPSSDLQMISSGHDGLAQALTCRKNSPSHPRRCISSDLCRCL